MMKQCIVTIGREFGSGGHRIGEALAKAMNMPFYDNEILTKAAEKSGICEEVMQEHDEKAKPSYLFSVSPALFGFPGGGSASLPLNQRIFLAQFDAITHFASEGPCVIVGRCADYVLREHKNTVNIFVYASMESRVRRIAKLHGLSEKVAKDDIIKMDRQRQSYYNFFADGDWGERSHYDLMLSTDHLTIDACVRVIQQYIEQREAE